MHSQHTVLLASLQKHTTRSFWRKVFWRWLLCNLPVNTIWQVMPWASLLSGRTTAPCLHWPTSQLASSQPSGCRHATLSWSERDALTDKSEKNWKLMLADWFAWKNVDDTVIFIQYLFAVPFQFRSITNKNDPLQSQCILRARQADRRAV